MKKQILDSNDMYADTLGVKCKGVCITLKCDKNKID